ncbi:MAG: hypothetical protein M4579_001924 [Chaenotheca gracillima]|nr:MAG: hypothetical protein M4579_001924 [Chaenotheca gracillima]
MSALSSAVKQSSTKALIIGISGCSSSGKTTLSRLLRDIFPNTTIIHQDDFYEPEERLPFRDGLRDWDCAEAVDIPGLATCLEHITTHGSLPTTLISKEDQNEVGPSNVPPEAVEALQAQVRKFIDEASSAPAKLFLLDGFLLYPPVVHNVIAPFLHLRLLLRASYIAAKQRRESRKGYVTLEGFWEDPPGYVDRVVWPNYVESHGFLFEGGDVEGRVDERVCGGLGLKAFHGDVSVKDADPVGADMVECLNWAVGEVLGMLGGGQ